MSEADVKAWQADLNALGASLKVDGDFGALSLKASRKALGLLDAPAAEELPWIAEGFKVLGWHEATDKTRLSAWLKSGGKYLGDPSQLPWCGDFMETCVAKSLPDEVLPGALGQNPFFAQNWQLFGVSTAPTRGAAVAIRWTANTGHTGWLLGQNGSNYVLLGGNQGNRVSIAEFPKSAVIATRWPASYPPRLINLPTMTASQVIASVAETR
jgi:hypothetical protein